MLSLIESAGIPVPSEVVLPFAGFLVASGRLTIIGAALVATLGNYAGSAVYVLIHKADIEKGDAWFARHGVKAVFFGRLLPVVRTFISLPAGAARMNFKKFSLYTILGALPWNLALVYAGYKAGQNWDSFKPYFHTFDIALGAAVLLLVIWYVVKKRRHAHA